MHVVARLSEYLLTQLRVAAGRDHTLVAVSSWAEFAGALAQRSADVAVLEPVPVSPEELAPLLRLLARHPTIPVVVYTSVSPAAMRVTVELAKRGVHHVVFRGIDDAPARFRALLQDLAGTTWQSSLWPWVHARVARGPASLERATRELFDVPERFHDVGDLAAAAGLTRRTVERWLARVGIASAKLLVVSARVERAHHLMRSSAAEVAAVASKLGYSSPRLFARQVLLTTGRPPTGLRYALTAEDLHARLTAAIATGQSSSTTTRRISGGRTSAPLADAQQLIAG